MDMYIKHTLDYFCHNFKQCIQEQETDIHTWNQNPKISLLQSMHPDFNQCIWRFAYHTRNHNYHEYKFVYYINAAADATTTNNKVTGIAQLNGFSCANKARDISKYCKLTVERNTQNIVIQINTNYWIVSAVFTDTFEKWWHGDTRKLTLNLPEVLIA